MARKNLETPTTDAMERLKALVPVYYEDKQEQSRVKSSVDAGNADIKSCMEELGIDSVDIDGLKVTVSTQDRESFNEDKLLATIREKAGSLGIIKTREYVDMDALEDAIYKGLVSDDVLLSLDACKEHKYVTTLRVTKSKKKKEDE